MRTSNFVVSLAIVAALLGTAWSVSAQDKSDAKKSDDAKESKKADDHKAASKDKTAQRPVVIAITGADVYTVTRGTIRGATVLVKDGKIAAVGQDVDVPASATRIDAMGKIVTPGFIAISASNLGIRATGGGPGGGPGGGQPKSADSLNPFDRNMLFCLSAGITTACVEVGGGGRGRFGRDSEGNEFEVVELPDDTQLCPCCGLPIQSTEPIGPTPPTERTARRQVVLKLSYGDMAPMLVKETPFYHVPAGSFSGALNRHNWRETIKRAKQQVKDRAAADTALEFAGGMGGGGSGRRVPEEVIKLVEKKIPLRTEAFSRDQIRDAIALAKELDYNLILDNVDEAWLTAADIGAAKIDVVITPRSRRRPQPGKEDHSGSSIENSAYLEKAGVSFAVSPLGESVSLDGIPGRDLTSLPIEAMFAVRGGATEQAALAALTIVPARMMGLEARLGSIEEGKDADLLILDGPPLDYRTAVDKAIVGGKVYYDRTKDRILPERAGK